MCRLTRPLQKELVGLASETHTDGWRRIAENGCSGGVLGGSIPVLFRGSRKGDAGWSWFTENRLITR